MAGAAALICLTAILMGAKSGGIYAAHEWGTFTSVQGGDGALLNWRPLESSRLPKFVYDWNKPGLNRQGTSGSGLTKVVLTTLQRMETPVIYFYSDKEQTVDVSVDFPKGLITEWYPQAEQIGPSTVPAPAAVVKLDDYAHQAGVKPSFTFASLLRNSSLKESRARWMGVRILAAKQDRDLASLLPTDRSGSHYFAARETDANYLQVPSLVATNPAPEQEKFIFYRGVGSFPTPLRVTMNLSNAVTVANTGEEPLVHLFVLGLDNGAGRFIEIEQLLPGEQRTLHMELRDGPTPLSKLSRQLGDSVTKSLVKEGLYRREATAMVNTWKDSWFAEDGMRVLFVLPRAWTDRTLPMKLDPAPRELVRVMVGRAEVLAPALEQRLSDELVRASQGDAHAREQATTEFKQLGRFAEPALRLATKNSRTEVSQTAWTIFQAAATPANGNQPALIGARTALSETP